MRNENINFSNYYVAKTKRCWSVFVLRLGERGGGRGGGSGEGGWLGLVQQSALGLCAAETAQTWKSGADIKVVIQSAGSQVW